METVFIKIVNMSISAGWLVLAVIVARFLLKKAPKWVSVLLWGLVGLRLVMPFTIKSGFSLLPSAEVISPSIGYAKNPTINSGISAFDNAVNPALGATLTANPGDSANPMQVWIFIFSIIWIAGIIILLTYGLISYLRLYKRVSEAALLKENVWICDRVETPFILGIFRPRIYLPSSLDEKDMEYVLSHEKAHLRRKDHIWKPIGFLLLSVYWFNPLIWAAYILLCRDIEMACDEKVITDLETSEKKAYANALVSCSMQRRLVIACPLAFGEVGVKERVKAVLNYKKPAFWITIFAIIACVVVAACFLTSPKPDEKDSHYNLSSVGVYYGIYMYGDLAKLGILSNEDGEYFSFGFDPFSSYMNIGSITEEDGKLICKTSDGKYTYVFDIKDAQTLIFDAKRSASVKLIDPNVGEQIEDGSEFHFSDQLSAAGIQTDIDTYRTDYIGDAPKVSQIAMRLPYPDGYSYSSIEIQSAHEPYGLTVYLNGDQPISQDEFEEAARVAFGYIGNMGTIRFCKADTKEELAAFERGEVEGAYDRIPCVMVNGRLYLDTGMDASGMIPPTPDSSFDGAITSEVDGSELPTRNDQSNFGTGFGYKTIDDSNIAIYMNQNWCLFRQENDSYSYGTDISYGSSQIYSQEDMISAVNLITDEFNTWEGCELHSIRYTSDDCNSRDNIAWMNELAKAQGLDIVFTQCIEFVSDFHSPVDSAEAGAWNPDEEYTDWQWWLARTDNGEWHLMTMGY